MTLAELRTKADAKLAVFWDTLVSKQEVYFAKHGKYFQLLVTPNTSVVDGVDSDFTLRHPSDAKFVIDIEVPIATKIPFNIEVHEWVGADKGFTAFATVELPDGRRFRRSRNSKNEDSGWSQVMPMSYV